MMIFFTVIISLCFYFAAVAYKGDWKIGMYVGLGIGITCIIISIIVVYCLQYYRYPRLHQHQQYQQYQQHQQHQHHAVVVPGMTQTGMSNGNGYIPCYDRDDGDNVELSHYTAIVPDARTPMLQQQQQQQLQQHQQYYQDNELPQQQPQQHAHHIDTKVLTYKGGRRRRGRRKRQL